MATTTPADELTAILLAADVSGALWEAVDSGRMADLVPELLLLEMEQDPIHRHKDVLAHTIAVVAKTPADLLVRLGTLFHDIGKPDTRRIDAREGVTFRHHETVGARITKHRLAVLGYDEATVDAVTDLVRLSGRFKGYADGWSDSAVRRYARDAGPLLGQLNTLVRCDCTTRNDRKRLQLQEHVDHLEQRIAELAEADRRAAERPQMDGAAVMDHLGLQPGPDVGAALQFLLAVRRSEGDLDRQALQHRLDQWWAERQS
ncbi:MAG: HDIG domain-containing protein [Acidimicrobiia bacterium]|nr:HDIG domain-containing protein [Acidimicrobiia bacterium]MDH5237644.1 HDIG domain-containing protein [Acidimicrobiia bacterium]